MPSPTRFSLFRRANGKYYLAWDNVDLDRRLIHFESSKGYRTKGGKRRTVPISNVLYGWLARDQRDRSFFVFHRDGRRLGADYVSHLFKRYVPRLGLDERLHLPSRDTASHRSLS